MGGTYDESSNDLSLSLLFDKNRIEASGMISRSILCTSKSSSVVHLIDHDTAS